MAQVGVQSRPVSNASGPLRLPQIEHPLSRMSNASNLDVQGLGSNSRGQSRAGAESVTGRPLASEHSYKRPSAGSYRGGSCASRTSNRAAKENREPTYQAIPEGIEVTQGDPNKARLPVFGARADMASRAEMESRVQSRMSSNTAQRRLEIDELESLLRERVNTGYFELKRKFKDNDPEGKGNVSREALHRILTTTLSRPLSSVQFAGLMERLGFRNRQVLSFQEFFAVFRDAHSSEYPRWMDPVQRNWQARDTLTVSQVHSHLQAKAQQRVKDIADLIPQANPDGSGHILKHEFRTVLEKMGMNMDDTEFKKLWKQYDPDGVGSINGEKLMASLGVSISELQRAQAGSSSSGVKKRQADRQRSMDIENWLKSKFREGFKDMKAKFESFDSRQFGVVSHDQFLKVLNGAGLKLEKSHLAEFLARCSVQPTRTDVPYREFLHRFLDRSEQGMAHKILTNPKHAYNRPNTPEGQESTLTALESQLMNMFQRDFLALLGTFHKIDRLGMETISPEEFRAAIESRFELEMSEPQFNSLMDRVPQDVEGNVKYAEFMSQFDTKGQAASLFNGAKVKPKPKYKAIGALPRDPSPIPEDDEPVDSNDAFDPVSDEPFENFDKDYRPKRPCQEIFKLIKDLMKSNFQAVEQAFVDLDEMNTGRLSQEMMFQLLQNFDFNPPISRGEIRDLWKTFITNTDKTLEFLQFARHFGYSLKSAAFPNAKVIPPRKGDSDFLMRSRKLNGASDMLHDNLRAKIDYMWEDLRREFQAMDPYQTGFVSAEEFQDIVSELCIQLTDFELHDLTTKFRNSKDNRVNYIEFLKPYAVKRQSWRFGDGMQTVMNHPTAQLPVSDAVEPPQKGLIGLTAKFRGKLASDWKVVRRAFKKMDTQNTGKLSLPQFRSVLQLANVVLTEEDVYQIMDQFDSDLSGKISYKDFLSQACPDMPESRQSSRAGSVRRSALW